MCLCEDEMVISERWVNEARGRRSAEDDIWFENFLAAYKTNESRRSKKDRGSRGADWKRADLQEKRVLVIGENGVGDEILTAGCLSDLSRECSHVTWCGDQKLQSLFRRSFPGIEFISQRDTEPTVDVKIYSWELIGQFRPNLDSFEWLATGKFEPYIHASPVLKHGLKARYSDGSKKVIGLAWRSERNGAAVSDKNCDLRDVPAWENFFARLDQQVRFVSLQYGDTEDAIAFARWKYGAEIYQDGRVDIFDDIDAAASQISTMDYVVSISTTTAHLAGAMGIPGWVLLQRKPFAHWQAGKAICPWYPTFRPVRQDTAGNWDNSIHRVTDELLKEIEIAS